MITELRQAIDKFEQAIAKIESYDMGMLNYAKINLDMHADKRDPNTSELLRVIDQRINKLLKEENGRLKIQLAEAKAKPVVTHSYEGRNGKCGDCGKTGRQLFCSADWRIIWRACDHCGNEWSEVD